MTKNLPFLFGNDQNIIEKQEIVDLLADFPAKGQFGLSVLFPVDSGDVTALNQPPAGRG